MNEDMLEENQADAENNNIDDGEDLIQNPSIDIDKKAMGTCPVCNSPIYEKGTPCKKCGYSGYINMDEGVQKKIRFALFFVFMAVAVILLLLANK